MSEVLDKLFNDMTGRYKPNVIEEPISFYFSLGEQEGQKWFLELTPEQAQVRPGKGDADVFLKTSEDRFLSMIRGEWKPGIMDFMKRTITSNDPLKLQVLKDCFHKPQI